MKKQSKRSLKMFLSERARAMRDKASIPPPDKITLYLLVIILLGLAAILFSN